MVVVERVHGPLPSSGQFTVTPQSGTEGSQADPCQFWIKKFCGPNNRPCQLIPLGGSDTDPGDPARIPPPPSSPKGSSPAGGPPFSSCPWLPQLTALHRIIPLEQFAPTFSRSSCGCPSIRAKALSRHSCSEQCFEHRVVARDGGGPRLWKSHGESFPGETNRFTNHRYGPDLGHDSSIRTPIRIGARAPNQHFGLSAVADDQGHPRAALDRNDLRIPLLRAQHPVES